MAVDSFYRMVGWFVDSIEYDSLLSDSHVGSLFISFDIENSHTTLFEDFLEVEAKNASLN